MLPIPSPSPPSQHVAQSGAAGALANIQLISEQDDHTVGDVQQTILSRPRSTPVRLSPSFPLIPAKLVAKIQSLQYVELKEFLPDNLELMKRMEAVDRAAFSGLPPSLRPKMREVPSIAAWAYCFGQYVAVLAESHPHLVKDRLTYMCLILSEARKNGGRGWSDYDTLFRQHAAAGDQEPSHPELQMDWTRLETSLHATYLVGGRDREGRLCRHCGGSDHEAEWCALRALTHPRTEPKPGYMPAPSTPPSHYPRGKTRTPTTVPICIQWNRGDCSREVCRYRHACATCPGDHRASECPKTDPDSFYKRASGRRQALAPANR